MGWGALDDLDDAYKWVSGLAKKTGDTAVDLARLTPTGLMAGAVVDASRIAIPGGNDKTWRRGPGRHIGLKASGQSFADAFDSEKTVTGAAISAMGTGFHQVSKYGWLGALGAYRIHSATADTADPIHWGEAYDLALQRPIGETNLLANTAETQRDAAYAKANGLPVDPDDKFYSTTPVDFRDMSTVTLKGKKGEPSQEIGRQFATAASADPEHWKNIVAFDNIAIELMDPTFAKLAHGAKGAKEAYNFARQGQGWERLAGKWDEAAGFTPGKLDEWNAAERYAHLRLDKQPQGKRLLGILDWADTLDPAAKLDVRLGVAKVLNKDVDGIELIGRHDPLIANELDNMVTGRATGSIDAGLAEDAAHEAGDTTFKPYHQADVTAEGLAAAQLDPSFEKYGDLIVGGKPQAMRVSSSGNRAADRLKRTSHKNTGKYPPRPPKPGTEVAGEPPESLLLPGGNNRPSTVFLRNGLRTIGWASGITPTAKALKFANPLKLLAAGGRVSDNFRDSHVYGGLRLDDDHLVQTTMRGFLRQAGVTQKTAEDFLSRAATAPTPEATGPIVIGALQAAGRTMALRHGQPTEVVERLIRSLQEDGRSFLTGVEGEIYSAQKNPETGRRAGKLFAKTDEGDIAFPAQGPGEDTPLYGSQAINTVMVPNLRQLDAWLKADKTLTPFFNKVGRMRDRGVAEHVIEDEWAHFVRDHAERYSSLWKASALLLRGVAYAARNQGEEYMRAGAARSLLAVIGRSIRQQKSLTWRGNLKVDRKATFARDEVLTAQHAQLDELEYHLEAEKSALGDVTDGLDFDFVKGLEDEAADLRTKIAERESLIDTQMVPDSGDLAIPVPGGAKMARGAFADAEGRGVFDDMGGEASTLDMEMLTAARAHGKRLRTNEPYINGPDMDTPKDRVQLYHEALYEVFNRHIRTSGIGRAALRARADGATESGVRDAVRSHLASAESAPERAKIPTRTTDLDGWATDVATDVYNLVRHPELAKRLLERDATKEDVREFFKPGMKDELGDDVVLPPVQESGASINFGGAFGRYLDRSIRWLFDGISKFSTDRLTRHPHFALMYEDDLIKAVQRLEVAGVNVSEPLMRKMESAARKSALQSLKRTYYQNSSRSTAAHQLRFISPFFAAHQDSVRAWTELIGENPEYLRRAFVAYKGLEANHVVTNQDGSPIKPGEFPNSDHVLTFSLRGDLNYEVHPASALFMLQQGTATNPGFGPYSQITVGSFREKIGIGPDDLTPFFNYFLPYGYDGPTKAVMPRVVQRIKDHYDKEWRQHSDESIRLYHQELQAGVTDFRLAHQDEAPTEKDMRAIDAAAVKKMKLKSLLGVIFSFGAPIGPSAQSPYSALIDTAKRYQDEARITHPHDPNYGTDKFIEDYGDAYVALTMSPSMGGVGVDPTRAAGASMARHKGLRHKVSPKLWALIVGPESRGDKSSNQDFDMNVYKHIRQELMDTPYGDGKDPSIQYQYDVEVAAGWAFYDREYGKLMVKAHEAGARGPEEVPELLAKKKELRAYITARHPQWAQGDFAKKEREWPAIEADAKVVAADPKLAHDSGRYDIALLGNYLRARDIQQKLFDAEAQRSGLTSYSGQHYDKLRWMFANHVQDLKEANLDFEKYAMRSVVDRDPLYDEDALLLGGRR